MRYAIAILGLLLYSAPVLAADPIPQDRQAAASLGPSGALLQNTGKGSFTLELSLRGDRLAVGPNALDLTLRDHTGRTVEGAEITITPWMPTMGHGVWDKPVLTERGGGKYHAQNVKIIMAGLWELRVSVRKGTREERAIFRFEVSEVAGSRQVTEQREMGYQRSLASYQVPNVALLNQDGEPVTLRALIDSGKPVILNFIFTSCTTICPLVSALLANLRSELGDRAASVQIISVSIDPEHDRPELLKQYGTRFDAGKGWSFLTGSRDDIDRVLQAFDALIEDKMSHEPLYMLRGPHSEQWVRIRGVIGMGDLLNEFRRIENK